jgi:membrane protein YdbS with pleckstrin-like domain
MSNGTPEPFEDKVGKPLGIPVTLAIAYTLLWTATAVVYWILSLSFPGWVLWSSLALLALSLVVIFRGPRN